MRRNSIKYSIKLRDIPNRISLNFIDINIGTRCSINIYKHEADYQTPRFTIVIAVTNKEAKQEFKGRLCIYDDSSNRLIKEVQDSIKDFFHANGVVFPNKIKEYITNNLKRTKEVCFTTNYLM